MSTIQSILRNLVPQLPQEGTLRVRDLMNTALISTDNPVVDSFSQILNQGMNNDAFRQTLVEAVQDTLSEHGGGLYQRMMEQGVAMGTDSRLLDLEQLTAVFGILKSKGVGAVQNMRDKLLKGADSNLAQHINRFFGALEAAAKGIPVGQIRDSLQKVIPQTKFPDAETDAPEQAQSPFGTLSPFVPVSPESSTLDLITGLPEILQAQNNMLPMFLKVPKRVLNAQSKVSQASAEVLKAAQEDPFLQDALIEAYQKAFQAVVPQSAARYVDKLLSSRFDAPVNRETLEKLLNLKQLTRPVFRQITDVAQQNLDAAYQAADKPVPECVTKFFDAARHALDIQKTVHLKDLVHGINQFKRKLKGGGDFPFPGLTSQDGDD